MSRWVPIIVVLGLLLGAGSWLIQRDPWRTVPELPLANFLESPAPYAGQTIRADLAVAGEIANSETKGRLMSFSDPGTGLHVVLLVPPSLDRQIFSKNQRFACKMRVGKGGLLHVEAIRKL